MKRERELPFRFWPVKIGTKCCTRVFEPWAGWDWSGRWSVSISLFCSFVAITSCWTSSWLVSESIGTRARQTHSSPLSSRRGQLGRCGKPHRRRRGGTEETRRGEVERGRKTERRRESGRSVSVETGSREFLICSISGGAVERRVGEGRRDGVEMAFGFRRESPRWKRRASVRRTWFEKDRSTDGQRIERRLPGRSQQRTGRWRTRHCTVGHWPFPPLSLATGYLLSDRVVYPNWTSWRKSNPSRLTHRSFSFNTPISRTPSLFLSSALDFGRLQISYLLPSGVQPSCLRLHCAGLYSPLQYFSRCGRSRRCRLISKQSNILISRGRRNGTWLSLSR